MFKTVLQMLLVLVSVASLYAKSARIEIAEELLVDVSAADPTAGTATWNNNGTLGDFDFVTEIPIGSNSMTAGTPQDNLSVEGFMGVPVVHVTSSTDGVAAYRGPNVPDSILADEDRSVEIWVADLKDSLPGEQALVAWGGRGAGDGGNCSINLGHQTFGAWGLWGDDYDTGFAILPTVGIMHHLVYVYDGNEVRLYIDGELDNVRIMSDPLKTPEGPINFFIQGRQKEIDGVEVMGLSSSGLANQVSINSIRVHAGTLTEEQVSSNYQVGPSRVAGLIAEDSNTLVGFEPQIIERLQSLGYVVDVIKSDDVAGGNFSVADAEALDVLVVSESIGSSDLTTLVDANVPMMNGEAYSWHRMDYAVDDGSAAWVDANGWVDLVNETHAIVVDANLAMGIMEYLMAENAVTTVTSTSSLAPGAENLVSLTRDSNEYTLVFALESGDDLANDAGVALNRIVGFSLPGYDDVNNILSEYGWSLFDASIRWLNPVPVLWEEPVPESLEVAGELLVSLSALDPTAGTATWINQGSLGDFNFITEFPPNSSSMTVGSPEADLTVTEFDGIPVVKVKSNSSHAAAYQGPDAPESIIGDQDRSVECWVADLTTSLPEEQCLVAWGARGAGSGGNCSANLGDESYGAWGLYGDDYDTGFSAPPSVGVLHHIAYVIDANNDAKLYVDGALDNVHRMAGALNTPEASINLFMQNKLSNGSLALDSKGLPEHIVVNSIRIHSEALNADQVLNNYVFGPAKEDDEDGD